MTANMIIRFFEDYGWIMTLLATTGIVFVGCLKAMGIYSKLKPNAKKYVYFITACVVSIISCTVYLCVSDKFIWADWGVTVVFIIAYTMALYALYENTGIRALLKKFVFDPVKNAMHKILTAIMSQSLSREEAINIAKGLGENILAQLIDEMNRLDSEDKNISFRSEAASDIVEEEPKTPTVSQYQNPNFFS